MEPHGSDCLQFPRVQSPPGMFRVTRNSVVQFSQSVQECIVFSRFGRCGHESSSLHPMRKVFLRIALVRPPRGVLEFPVPHRKQIGLVAKCPEPIANVPCEQLRLFHRSEMSTLRHLRPTLYIEESLCAMASSSTWSSSKSKSFSPTSKIATCRRWPGRLNLRRPRLNCGKNGRLHLPVAGKGFPAWEQTRLAIN